MGPARVVVAEGLTKYYGKSRGVEGLHFEVRAGEVFGYLGPNGAGKTTTIRTLLDLLRPTKGRASIFEMDTHRNSIEIRRRIGYLPGELSLYDNLTSRQYLDYFASLRGGSGKASVDGLAERLRLELDIRIKSLSHGNRQKAALIQAFMHEPDLLVLDEPTQGLDPLVQQEFYSLVDEARDAGRTVFISSHVLPEIERLCDRVGIIREGRLVEVADVGDLKAKAQRTVEVHFSHPVDPTEFASLPGVRDAHMLGDILRCTITGPMDPLVKALARHEVTNLETREQSLEDIFLAFYGNEGSGVDDA